MRLRAAVAAMVLVVVSGCGSGPVERTVLVDFQHDEFASEYWRFFPRKVAARPGDTVVFRQEWTGAPHTVTFGRLVDEAIPRIAALEKKYADLDEDAPKKVVAKAEREFDEAQEGLPTFFPHRDAAAQNAMFPCYLRTGQPPTDPDTPCTPSQRRQPDFDGRFAFYSSGFIPPSGPSANTYEVRLTDDIEPGTYGYYCTIHFPFMQGQLSVLEPDAELPTQAQVSRQTREEIEVVAEPLRKAFADAKRGEARYRGERRPLPLAGFHPAEDFTTAINEFVPKTHDARAGEPVTWTIVGAHTVSFDVPRYMPIYFVGRDGKMKRNTRVDRAAGGSPDPPEVTFDEGPYRIDGGRWDGEGFISSGLIASEPYSTYTLRISKPGRYRYACLVHPKMVGTLTVRR